MGKSGRVFYVDGLEKNRTVITAKVDDWDDRESFAADLAVQFNLLRSTNFYLLPLGLDLVIQIIHFKLDIGLGLNEEYSIGRE